MSSLDAFWYGDLVLKIFCSSSIDFEFIHNAGMTLPFTIWEAETCDTVQAD